MRYLAIGFGALLAVLFIMFFALTASRADGLPAGHGDCNGGVVSIEDSDEFLTSDAKQRSGQSMSRLLNLTSGFIGQGLNTLVLITTNEPIDSIHKALQREGRCMANVEFGALTEEEGQIWAESQGSTKIVDGSHSIADLYAMLRDHRQVRTGSVKPKMGFAVKS